MRLDVYLVENNFFSSRTKAQFAIKNGDVDVNGAHCRPSYDVLTGDVVTVRNNLKYVGRGGYKLEKAIDMFKLDFSGKTVLDIGASTGGFTDCALINGAAKVYALDVGHGQLDRKLVYDDRVVNLEGTDIRNYESDILFDIATVDVSFISLENVLPYIRKHIREDSAIICLVKPQFEIGRKRIKNGVVKSEKDLLSVLQKVIVLCEKNDYSVVGITKSPILGGDGNTEFLFYMKNGYLPIIYDLKHIIKEKLN